MGPAAGSDGALGTGMPAVGAAGCALAAPANGGNAAPDGIGATGACVVPAPIAGAGGVNAAGGAPASELQPALSTASAHSTLPAASHDPRRLQCAAH